MTWTIEDSKKVYGINNSDLHFIDIDDTGELQLIIKGNKIGFNSILKKLESMNINNSFTLRIPQLINYQVEKIQNTFMSLIKKYEYRGRFKPLYPIKVNQQKLEVHTVVNSSNYYGLEAGTKSEFLLLLKIFQSQKHRLIMCNGVKDREYMAMIRDAVNDGYAVYVSIESITEAELVYEIVPYDKLNLLLRIKPYVDVKGYWGSSASRNSKFGLAIHDLLSVLEYIVINNFSDRLIGIHAHPGSQIEDINDLKKYIRFMIDIFKEIMNRGFSQLRIIDFGGGLPVDYHSDDLKDPVMHYAEAIFQCILNSNLDKHPNIMIESGRAVTALSSMVVVEPIEAHSIFPERPAIEIEYAIDLIDRIDKCNSIKELSQIYQDWSEYSSEEFSFDNLVSVEYYSGIIKNKIRYSLMNYTDWYEFDNLEPLLYSNVYLYGNFSVFNSAADAVVVDQYFPLFPVINLHLQPESIVRLVDISCDSDGEISMFKTKHSDKPLFSKDNYPLTSDSNIFLKGFPVGKLSELDKTHIVIPLVGAYQDIIEANHNLIGDLADVMIIYDDGWKITLHQAAQSIEDIVKELGYTLAIDADPYVNF